MDVGFFLKDRIVFVRQFYDAASGPFIEKKRKIEVGEDPFIPPYSEDGEPPFLSEWLEAEDSLQILGCSCISMLSASLHLYFRARVSELRVPVGDSFKSKFKNKGWLHGYKAYFAEHFDIDFAEGPANFSILEEIVLARNQTQHPNDIVSLRASYSPEVLGKLPHAFFVDEIELRLLPDADERERLWLFQPRVHVTREKLFAATADVGTFSDWLESEIDSKCQFR